MQLNITSSFLIEYPEVCLGVSSILKSTRRFHRSSGILEGLLLAPISPTSVNLMLLNHFLQEVGEDTMVEVLKSTVSRLRGNLKAKDNMKLLIEQSISFPGLSGKI